MVRVFMRERRQALDDVGEEMEFDIAFNATRGWWNEEDAENEDAGNVRGSRPGRKRNKTEHLTRE